ncbi:putative bifunctional diguanylate cyclase/phosphodiesterase [Erythrobacter sp. WG]|uniref:putative bifunctional diguanylate cyclase/phosphodiesterase n=1 Tax=Erythrobacter sp. WG TaxID=2985510 RepID=UPI00226E14A1|nr:EAL domain-containing protein [Erythrobacter sp. WG]MCX9146487.1 EAL domain-containing protein [Erythrobacter sp. WG]
MTDKEPDNPLHNAERDFVALGIAAASIILLIGTGGSVVPQTIQAMLGYGDKPDMVLANALLLNVALIIFGWRRYRELTREIAERRRAEARAQVLASTDPLTGCLNRRAMFGETEAIRTRAAQRGEAVAYCMIDLDNFKQINDMHGHVHGDAVLVMLCERIRALLPREARLARLGGDEFAFVMPFPAGHPERIDDLAIRLFESFAEPIQLPEVTIDVTLSIGIAADHEPDGTIGLVVDASTLMHRADMALYHAKKQGRNRYFWFEPSMESELRFRHSLETGIRRGLSRGEFLPFYEQQIDVETGALVGFEMLARWRSPDFGLVSPDVFVPVAEEIGLISEMSERLMERAFADAREWHDSLTLSINISPVQLRDPWFAQRLLKMLVAANFPPRRLEIEITESCLHENIGLVRSMITSLRNQGVQIALDDFGTGYSSLEQLRNLPFDRIKIDRSFVAELREPSNRSHIVEAIVSLGRGLDLPLTAEGVEDEDILMALKRMGRLKAQGYLYGLPEDADAVRARLREAGQLVEQAGESAPSPIAVVGDAHRRQRGAQS